MESKEFNCDIVEQMKIMNNRLTIVCILLAVLLAGTNMAWLLFISQYDFYTYSEGTITIESSGAGNAILQQGRGNEINGKDCSQE